VAEQDLDRGHDRPNGSASRATVRRIAAEHDAGRNEQGRPSTTSTSSTASADAVDALRRSVRDLKYDVRMLKVVVDKQSALLEQVLGRLQQR